MTTGRRPADPLSVTRITEPGPIATAKGTRRMVPAATPPAPQLREARADPGEVGRLEPPAHARHRCPQLPIRVDRHAAGAEVHASGGHWEDPGVARLNHLIEGKVQGIHRSPGVLRQGCADNRVAIQAEDPRETGHGATCYDETAD